MGSSQKRNPTTRFLIYSFIGLLIFSMVIFSLLGIYMNRKSKKTIYEVGEIYMSGMNEQMSRHFETVIKLRFNQVSGIVSVVSAGNSDKKELYEELAYRARVREFDYLALCSTEGAFETIYGQPIQYTDYIGLMMSSITTIINSVSYVLIAFVAISLVVSSIMIGIITYISVLERTKEIGILRAVGASKRDVSRVFNAETLAVGFSAGLLGIIVTLLLNIPLNLVIESLSGISGVAALPWQGAVILIVISMFLTFIAGLIPSRVASNKDPVVALRTE